MEHLALGGFLLAAACAGGSTPMADMTDSALTSIRVAGFVEAAGIT